MIEPSPTSFRSLALTVALSAALLAPVVVVAAPERPRTDAVMQLLVDKGLLPAAMSSAPVDRPPAPLENPAPHDDADHTRDAPRPLRDRATDLVISAMNFLGVRYRHGGSSAGEGFDCSGFTRHVFERSLGLLLPRRADQQAALEGLARVARDELRPGDLVFFNTLRRAFSHVGIYVGEGKFIHSPRAGGEVRVEDMRDTYWTQRFNGARRADLPAFTR